MIVVDYKNQIFEDGFTKVTSDQWPDFFSNKMKRDLVNKFILHFREEEDFDKCQELQKILKKNP